MESTTRLPACNFGSSAVRRSGSHSWRSKTSRASMNANALPPNHQVAALTSCSTQAAAGNMTAAVSLQKLSTSRDPSKQQTHKTSRTQRLCCAAQLTERELTIKLSIAQSTDRLDLSNCELGELPQQLFELTGLVELSLAGNQLSQLPADISKLSSLQRLVLAGNWLQHLPQELWELRQLEGLWVHGNLLQDVPEELGQLSLLKMLSLAGNQLTRVPESLTELVHLRDLNISGNQITQLPEGIGALTALTMLSLHGNQLRTLPQQGWQHLKDIKEITLQGNQLTEVPDTLAQLKSLTELSLADNQIRVLPEDLSGWANLQKFHCYSNCITELPLSPKGLPALLPLPKDTNTAGAVSSRPIMFSDASYDEYSNRDASSGGASLRSVDPGDNSLSSGSSAGRLVSLWLEGNPLSEACAAAVLEMVGAADTTRVGLDERQLVEAAAVQYEQLKAAGNKSVRRGVIKGSGPGYFKLQLGAGASSSRSPADDRVLVVAFGSAPGLPNWGGVMRQVAAAAEAPEQLCFDVLYVVDPYRSWYCGGDTTLMQRQYSSRLRQYTEQYKHVVMIGDSMGATGALLFSPQATAVLAFCPQVDLTTSSIRPGQPPAWQAALQDTLQAAVTASRARIKVFTGTWQHDVDQANLLEKHKHVNIKVYGVESHRLALALQRQRKLAPLIREAILGELGMTSGNVRLVNLL